MARKNISAGDLGIHFGDSARSRERGLFCWFIASFLFGKRVQQAVAARAYHVLIDEHGLDTPRKLGRRSWKSLVKLLGEGHYVRYDESTAQRLRALCQKLIDEYDGKLGRLHEQSTSAADLKRRLQEFTGIGPTTVRIFLREANKVWATPKRAD